MVYGFRVRCICGLYIRLAADFDCYNLHSGNGTYLIYLYTVERLSMRSTLIKCPALFLFLTHSHSHSLSLPLSLSFLSPLALSSSEFPLPSRSLFLFPLSLSLRSLSPHLPLSRHLSSPSSLFIRVSERESYAAYN